jgi:hypothetical protein
MAIRAPILCFAFIAFAQIDSSLARLSTRLWRHTPGRRVLSDMLEPGCNFYILDTNKLAEEHGLPTCNIDDVVTTRLEQVPLLKSNIGSMPFGPHYMSANSAPFFTLNALKEKYTLVNRSEDASVIVVDDYCYKMRWLASIHSSAMRGNVSDQMDGQILMEVYKAMLDLPAWTERNGTNFVFFDAHTGFAQGSLASVYESTVCETFGNAMHVVNTRGQRFRCRNYDRTNFVIAPTSVAISDAGTVADPFQKPGTQVASLADEPARPIRVFYRGKCGSLVFAWKPEDQRTNVGKLMRKVIVDDIRQAGFYRDQRVDVKCTGGASEKNPYQENSLPHEIQTAYFHSSAFCLVMPGDSQTSRRISEAILTGCLPVFPGAPYHTLPFADVVDYREFSLFFDIQDNARWAANTTLHVQEEPDARATDPTDSRWWIPDADYIMDAAIKVPNAQAMMAQLLQMSEDDIHNMRVKMANIQSLFSYYPHGDSSRQTASDVVISSMCHRADQKDAAYYKDQTALHEQA